MNIKKLPVAPMLSIDDPTIYQSEDDSEFLRIATATSVEDITDPTPDILYLIGSGMDSYIPYVCYQNGELKKMPNPFHNGPTLPYPDADTIWQLNDNLIAIDNHLYAIRKELSYWNLYKISYSVDNESDFSTILSSLAPGEALIINFEGILSYNNTNYSRGDVIVRLTNGQYVHIESSTSGFYYPKKLTVEGKKYNLTYGFYQGVAPTDPTGSLDDGNVLESPANEETFTVESASASDSFIYGDRVDVSEITSYHFDAAVKEQTTNPIPPIIKLFTENGEEVAADFTCTYVAGSNPAYNFEITSKPSALKYMYIK